MQIIYENYKKTGDLHHAYLIEGDVGFLIEEVLGFIEKELKIPTKANPDFWNREYEVMGIDSAREIKDFSSKKALSKTKKIFVMSCNSATVEAQNSLLKLLEEPTKDTHFFLITRSSDAFLPTLKSRMMIVKSGKGRVSELKNLAFNFLKSKKAERILLLKDIIKEKDKQQAIIFLDELEKLLRGRINLASKNKDEINALKKIAEYKKYLNTRSPSVKQILENTALIV